MHVRPANGCLPQESLSRIWPNAPEFHPLQTRKNQDFNGKPNVVRKASPESFVSLNDGLFGKDDRFVFRGATAVLKADVTLWHKIGGSYSKDGRRVYYGAQEIKEADYASFEVVPSLLCQLAPDQAKSPLWVA